MSGERPWIEGNLTIARAVLDDIEAHALACYPSECCGFASGPADQALVVDTSQREENEADKYHKLDPETFPRTSTTYFKINELRAAKAFDAGDGNGRPIKVIYHSHCDAGTYFSKEDANTFASNRQLMWPCAFIVVSVQDGKIADRKLWVHTKDSDDFHESTLTVR